MATTTAPEVENPRILSDPNPTEQKWSPSSADGEDESKVKLTMEAVKVDGVDGASAATDVQKKMKRAERFGMPVQLSEEDKRNSRAERFGTGSASHGSDSSKQSEDLKRKARAERFGIAQSAPTDEEAKKKARGARFGSVAKADSAEEEKKKAREIRFSQPQSGSLSKANVEENNELKTAISSKAARRAYRLADYISNVLISPILGSVKLYLVRPRKITPTILLCYILNDISTISKLLNSMTGKKLSTCRVPVRPWFIVRISLLHFLAASMSLV
ncbi:unnamed protein product [Fraxinus pennsylvanica]|uniref:THO1-MOS11 C-terminal domain-containing protein n=1 Tax=Fraxinus pennsylvanica TaxID=56036 RepID=A0AAD2A782_9LAMI|nr:unnamed protein product [Fraxinus pennsylvanica]